MTALAGCAEIPLTRGYVTLTRDGCYLTIRGEERGVVVLDEYDDVVRKMIAAAHRAALA